MTVKDFKEETKENQDFSVDISGPDQKKKSSTEFLRDKLFEEVD